MPPLASLTRSAPSATSKGAGTFTEEITVATLLAGFASGVEPPTENTFVSEPSAVGRTMMVAVAVSPFVSVPKVQRTVPPEKTHAPSGEVAETNVTLAGSTFVSVTAVPSIGREFATVNM